MDRSAAPRVSRLALLLSAAVVLALGAAFAVFALAAGSCPTNSVTLQATATATTLEPSELRVCRGQDVTLELSPEYSGVFHIHGIEESREVRPGELLTLEFTPEISGQFPIETHTEDDPEGRPIGILIVDEP
jgi:hypothetical protein